MSGASARRSLPWAFVDCVLVGVGFWLVAPVPVALVASPYDAGLFVRLANSLLAGEWLGRFDALTLAKGPFYPLFLAGCAEAGVPIQAGIEAVYLVGAVLMAGVVARLGRRKWAGSLCLALLVFNPACTDWSVGALMREPLYGALSLLVMALAARVFLCRGGIVWGVALGAAFAAFWLTREEGVLLVPSIAVLAAWFALPLVVIVAMLLRQWSVFVDANQFPAVSPPLTALCTATALVLGVCAINQHYYGVFRSNDFTQGPFPRAYGALARIAPTTWQRLTPISRDMRLRAYSVSPAARELQPFIESDSAHLTADVSCSETGQPLCREIPGASFIWALRDAAARAGYYATARRADSYFKRLAREIDFACDRGALRCLASRRGFTPPLNMSDVAPLLTSLGHVTWDMLLLGRAGPLVMPSTAAGADALAYAAVTRVSVVAPPKIPGAVRKTGGLRWAVMRGAGWAMERASLLITPIALAWLAYRLVWRRRFGAAEMLALALFIAVALRVALLALLDATSIERQFRYESPAVPLLLAMLATVVTLNGTDILRQGSRGSSACTPGPPVDFES